MIDTSSIYIPYEIMYQYLFCNEKKNMQTKNKKTKTAINFYTFSSYIWGIVW